MPITTISDSSVKGTDYKLGWRYKVIYVNQCLCLKKSHQMLLTTIFVDTQLWKTKHPRKRFQNFCQSWVLLKDRIEIHQSQPLVWPSDLLYVMLAGCDWWISIRSVDNMYDWQKFWKCFCGCFVFGNRVSAKTVVMMIQWGVKFTSLPRMTSLICMDWTGSNQCSR